MKFYRDFTFALLAILVLGANGSKSLAAVAGDDFDGGANNGGLTPTTFDLFEGDPNNGTATMLGVHYDDHDPNFNGLFDFGTGSRFDRWGPVNPLVTDNVGDEQMAADYLDQTHEGVTDPNGFLPYNPNDRLGIQPIGSNDSAFGWADTCNGQNINGDCAPATPPAPGQIKGSASAYWTFDISGGSSNMSMSIDFAAIGEFDNDNPTGVPATAETADFLTFTYSIDGGPFQTAFDVRPKADPNGRDTEEFYTVTMDLDPNGNAPGITYDRYPIPTAFFVEANWTFLTTSGPGFGVTWHPEDRVDSDPNNGFIDDLEGALGFEDSRAYTSSGFDNSEFEIYKNPMYVNADPNDPNSGVQLDNTLRTVAVPIVGSGSTLTLKLLGVGDGSLEWGIFDNILIYDNNADFNEDGVVDGLDFLAWQANIGTGTTKAEGDANGDGVVDDADLTIWEAQYGGPPPIVAAAGAVPEPASALLLGVGLALVTTTLRRRHV